MDIGAILLKLWTNSGFNAIFSGFLSDNGWQNLVMLVIGCVLLYLAIVKQFEPLLLVGIAFGCILTNLPNAGLYHQGLWDAFMDPANPAYHRQTTAAEILRDFAGRRLDHFVTGWGTGGTLTGVGEVLKVARPEVKITAAEPVNASLLAGNEWKPHKVQGWTPDFVPAVLNREVADQILGVADEDAIATARRLAAEEGIFVGISAGATVAAALACVPAWSAIRTPRAG